MMIILGQKILVIVSVGLLFWIIISNIARLGNELILDILENRKRKKGNNEQEVESAKVSKR